jgi:hypothetical protein
MFGELIDLYFLVVFPQLIVKDAHLLESLLDLPYVPAPELGSTVVGLNVAVFEIFELHF